jgi:essential nuclear protein 1
LDQSEREAIDRFMPEAPRQRFTLADMIMAKIQEKEQAAAMGSRKKEEGAVPGLNPKVIEVYSKVGTLLSRYKSGQVPKAFKIIPTLANWEEILYITQPENWTPNAVYEATRVFVSNLKAKQCQTFYSLVVLDRVRDDIQTSKKLNYHLYMTLKKCLFKPAAFFKGILFPLCEVS